MPRPRDPDAIRRAFASTWIDEAVMPDESRKKRIGAFIEHWERRDLENH